MDTTSAIPAGFRGAATRLTQADVDRAAQKLGITSRLVEAIASVEAKNMGFLPDGRPQLLYEAHVFHEETGGRFDATAPDLSSPIWNPSLYGRGGAPQYDDRLARAMLLDSEAALKASTWGMFQLLGRNFQALGYAAVDQFVAAMCESEGRQIDGFVTYCLVNNLATALQKEEWRQFAEGYNGPGAPNLYASRLIAAVNSGKFPPLPPGPTSPQPPPPGPPPAENAIQVQLRRGMEMVIPGVRGLGEDGQPYALTSEMFVSRDVQVASLAVTGDDLGTGQTIEILAGSASGATRVSCGQVLSFDVAVADPQLARIVIDMKRAVLKPLPTAAAAAVMALMMVVAPTGTHDPAVAPTIERPVVIEPGDAMWENNKISPVIFPHADRVSEGERLCLEDIRQPATAIERCLRWVHASRR